MVVCLFLCEVMCFSSFSIFLIIVGILDTRMMVRAMWAMGFAMVMFMDDVRVYSYPDGTVFNDVEYKALCEVFKASADLWDASKSAGKVPSNVLKSALSQALFGSTGGGDLESLKDELPKEYLDPGQRKYRCGYCDYKTDTYAGKSITHDLMCLCTPGKDAEPFYGYYWWLFGYYYKENGFKLCGTLKEEMGVDRSHGWYEEQKKRGTKGLEKAWKTVIMGCLKKWKNSSKTVSQDVTEKVKKLSMAMQNFTKALRRVNGLDKLGGFDEHNEADGTTERNLHVRYGNCEKKRKPWWKRLNETLNGKTPEDVLVDPSVSAQPTGAIDEPEEDGEFLEESHGESFESESPATQTSDSLQKNNGNSTHIPTTNSSNNRTMDTFNKTDSRNSTFPRIEYLRSNTPKTPPCSWLIGAPFFL
ncbi:Variant surface glycoprotein [Trypanosoma congolense IL3000]|uniref:Variant surface glycoprotein n=1 Tax=Trypanosoma congolense (strain IL3000) TaxID=1068625 RepID=F9WDE8_TRYCI|nr:Variant surface glycoprotein [Trypanosoma congolense IL3000]